MNVPMNALSPNAAHEPVTPALPTSKNVAAVQKAAAAADVEKTAVPTEKEKSAALEEINQSLQMASIGVRFEFDKEADTMVTKVMDVETGEMIRQMPSEEVMRFAKALDKLQGLLVSQKV